MNYIETTFGEAEGRPVKRLTLSEQGYRISLLNYGATLQSLVLPNGLDVCLGYDALADYQKRDGCLGATIGRYANPVSYTHLDVYKRQALSSEVMIALRPGLLSTNFTAASILGSMEPGAKCPSAI